jgi:hypothetical protein
MTTTCSRHRLVARGLQLSLGLCGIASVKLTRRSPPPLLVSMQWSSRMPGWTGCWLDRAAVVRIVVM